MRGSIEQFRSLLIAANLRLGVDPKEATRLGVGVAEIVAKNLAGQRLHLPARRRQNSAASQAAVLRSSGKTFAEIAAAQRCSRSTAHRRARRAQASAEL